MVKLDIRQESTRHSDVIDTITQYLGLGSYKCALSPHPLCKHPESKHSMRNINLRYMCTAYSTFMELRMQVLQDFPLL